jgi:predicted nucleotidyltransferase
MLFPTKEYYLRELSRITKENTNSVSIELANLCLAGIVSVRSEGRRKFYFANTACSIYLEIRSLIIKSEGAPSLLGREIAKLEGMRFAFVYGSTARGEDDSRSDIDVLMIGNPMPEKTSAAVRQTERECGREINHIIYPEAEFLSKIGSGFLSEIANGKKIMLKGTENEFERFAFGGLDKKSRA